MAAQILLAYVVRPPVALPTKADRKRHQLAKELLYLYTFGEVGVQNAFLRVVHDSASYAHVLPPDVRSRYLGAWHGPLLPYVLDRYSLPLFMAFVEFDCSVRQLAAAPEWLKPSTPLLVVGPPRGPQPAAGTEWLVSGSSSSSSENHTVDFYRKNSPDWGYELPSNAESNFVATFPKSEDCRDLDRRTLICIASTYFWKFIPKCHNPRVERPSTARQSQTDAFFWDLIVGPRKMVDLAANPAHFAQGLLPTEWLHPGSPQLTPRALSWLRITFLGNYQLSQTGVLQRQLDLQQKNKAKGAHKRRRDDAEYSEPDAGLSSGCSEPYGGESNYLDLQYEDLPRGGPLDLLLSPTRSSPSSEYLQREDDFVL
jgi:hypothetical protein